MASPGPGSRALLIVSVVSYLTTAGAAAAVCAPSAITPAAAADHNRESLTHVVLPFRGPQWRSKTLERSARQIVPAVPTSRRNTFA